MNTASFLDGIVSIDSGCGVSFLLVAGFHLTFDIAVCCW